MKGFFSAAVLRENCESYLQNLCGEAFNFVTLKRSHSSLLTLDVLMTDFASLFAPSLDIARFCPYDIR